MIARSTGISLGIGTYSYHLISIALYCLFASCLFLPLDSLQCNKYIAKHKGTPGTLTHRVYLKNADNVPISPFHDIPLKVRDGGKIRHEAVGSIVDKMSVFFLINS